MAMSQPNDVASTQLSQSWQLWRHLEAITVISRLQQ